MEISDTKSEPLFNLQENINTWIEKIKTEPSITEADLEELHSHLLDIIDDLKSKGLDDEEAFMVASKRLKISDDVATEYRMENNSILQMRRSLNILGGVLVFFFIYYFIKTLSKVAFVSIYVLSNSYGTLAIYWYEGILISWYFIFLLFLVSVYFLEKKGIFLIEKMKLKPKLTILLFLLTVVFGLADLYILRIIKKVLKGDDFVMSRYAHLSNYFELSFPFVVCIGFIFIYYKYYRKTGI